MTKIIAETVPEGLTIGRYGASMVPADRTGVCIQISRISLGRSRSPLALRICEVSHPIVTCQRAFNVWGRLTERSRLTDSRFPIFFFGLKTLLEGGRRAKGGRAFDVDFAVGVDLALAGGQRSVKPAGGLRGVLICQQ